MCGDWRGFWGCGRVPTGRRCTREMEVCHHLLYLFLGLLELVGKLLIGVSEVFHLLSLIGRGLAVRDGSGG